MNNLIKSKTNYITYEYTMEEYDDIIILANTEKKSDGIWLNLWLKTNDNMGIMHFVVGYAIKDELEATITSEVERLAENGYFDGSITLAFEDENLLESRDD